MESLNELLSLWVKGEYGDFINYKLESNELGFKLVEFRYPAKSKTFGRKLSILEGKL